MSVRSVEFDLVTRSEANRRGTSKKAAVIHAREVASQRTAVRQVLQARLPVPPMLHVIEGGASKANRIVVHLTRISAGIGLDPHENLPMAFKHVKDEIADWIGVNDRSRLVDWTYAQEAPGKAFGEHHAHVKRIRIDVTDLATGADRRVVVPESASAGRAAASRLKREITKATKGATMRDATRGDRRANHEAGERVRPASGKGSRASAEAAWSKVAKPTANDLRDAAERVGLARDPRRIRSPAEQDADTLAAQPSAEQREIWREQGRQRERKHLQKIGLVPRPKPDGDPGEEARARDLAPCTTCAALVKQPCRLDVGGRVVFGVHEARARAAGLHVPQDDRGTVAPARTGPRRLVPPAAPPPPPAPARERPAAYMALPWEQPACDACGGSGALIGVDPPALASVCNTCNGLGYRVARLVELRIAVLPDELSRLVPAEHQARYGTRIRLTRRRFSSRRTGDTWLFSTGK
jgi:hypothetical protein